MILSMPAAAPADPGNPARDAFERLVAGSKIRPTDVAAVTAALRGQTCYLPEPTADGLDELAEILAAHFTTPGSEPQRRMVELARRYPRQPLCHLYSFAIQRELGDSAAASVSLESLRETDPGDPMAEMFALGMAGEPIVAVSEQTRLANIAKLAATPLLKNPYQLAVGAIFETIRNREHARVLDVGVGSGAQMLELLRLLGRAEHQVRRLELVGLDFVDQFLEAAGARVAAEAATLDGRLDVTFEPVSASVDALDRATIERVRRPAGLDAANATIALHEVPGENKLTALRNLRALSPRQLVIAEWNYCLENVLPETSTEFVFNVRSAAAAMVAALIEPHPLHEARASVNDWLSQAGGQLSCPAAQRQECFLDITTWKALLEHVGFEVVRPHETLLAHADDHDHAAIGEGGWYVESSRYAGSVPIAVILAASEG
jgi:hypothetical protein